jgi:uncharacterized membrane protein YgcG
MKKIILAAALFVSATSVFATDVGVSITVGQPGFYGHIDIGDFPRPRLIYAEPRIIIRGGHGGPPMYLHVPPGHAKNWSKHCSRYNACGRPVYFVQESWYNDVYVPRYREREHSRGDHRDDRRGHDNDYRDDRRGSDNDYRDDRRSHNQDYRDDKQGKASQGNGNGKGNGQGKGNGGGGKGGGKD